MVSPNLAIICTMACGPNVLMQMPSLPKAGYSPEFGRESSKLCAEEQGFFVRQRKIGNGNYYRFVRSY